MANKATAAGVQADMQPPNYRAAVLQIRTTKAKKDRVSGINGEIAGVYAKVAGFKVNTKAGKIFYALDNMTPEDRADVMRSLSGLCDAAGWAETEQDLVDQAEDTVINLRFGRDVVADADANLDEALGDELPGDDVDEALADDFEASEEELAAQKGRQEAKAKAEAVKKPKKMAREPAPGTGAAAMKAASAPPYTGNNDDLAGDGFRPQGAA